MMLKVEFIVAIDLGVFLISAILQSVKVKSRFSNGLMILYSIFFITYRPLQ